MYRWKAGLGVGRRPRAVGRQIGANNAWEWFVGWSATDGWPSQLGVPSPTVCIYGYQGHEARNRTGLNMTLKGTATIWMESHVRRLLTGEGGAFGF